MEERQDLISRQAAIDALNGIISRFEQILRDIRESKVDDSVCGMCEYDGAFVGQSGDWCNECPGFEKDDCFKLSDDCRKRWLKEANLPSAQPERIRGRWIEKPHVHGVAYCSLCDYELHTNDTNFCPNCGAKMDEEDVDQIKRIEAEPVKHAHWVACEDEYEDEYKCSACGGIQFFAMTPQDEGWEYCPHCGAKMDEEEEK